MASDEIRRKVEEAAHRYGIDPQLLLRVASAESSFNPLALSPKGAIGPMQLMPGTAQELGVTDPWDVDQNIEGGARLLRKMLDRFGDPRLALAAYNAGPGAVSRSISRTGDIPNYPETQDYVAKILGNSFGGGAAPMPPNPIVAALQQQQPEAEDAPEILESFPWGIEAQLRAQSPDDDEEEPTADPILAAMHAQASEGGVAVGGYGNQPFLADVGEFIADQLDPINVAALLAGGAVGRGLLVGARGVGLISKGVSTAVGARTGGAVAAAVPSIRDRVLGRAIVGLGYNLPFSAAEILEEPPDGVSRFGEFGRSLLTLELFDVALMGVGGGLNRVRLGSNIARFRASTREATRASYNNFYEAAMRSGGTEADASRLAFSDLITQRIHDIEAAIGPEAAEKITSSVARIMTGADDDLLSIAQGMLDSLGSNPTFVAGMKQMGVTPDTMKAFTAEVLEQGAANKAARVAAEAAKAEELRTAARARLRFEPGAHGRLTTQFRVDRPDSKTSWYNLYAAAPKAGRVELGATPREIIDPTTGAVMGVGPTFSEAANRHLSAEDTAVMDLIAQEFLAQRVVLGSRLPPYTGLKGPTAEQLRVEKIVAGIRERARIAGQGPGSGKLKVEEVYKEAQQQLQRTKAPSAQPPRGAASRSALIEAQSQWESATGEAAEKAGSKVVPQQPRHGILPKESTEIPPAQSKWDLAERIRELIEKKRIDTKRRKKE